MLWLAIGNAAPSATWALAYTLTEYICTHWCMYAGIYGVATILPLAKLSVSSAQEISARPHTAHVWPKFSCYLDPCKHNWHFWREIITFGRCKRRDQNSNVELSINFALRYAVCLVTDLKREMPFTPLRLFLQKSRSLRIKKKMTNCWIHTNFRKQSEIF